MIRFCRLHSNPSVIIIPISAEAKKIPTMTYTVGDRDTLTSVAARFDTTPSELTSLNRLVGSFVYPGQQLLVPDKDKILEGSETTSEKSSPVNGSRDNLQDEKGRINFLVMKYDYGNHHRYTVDNFNFYKCDVILLDQNKTLCPHFFVFLGIILHCNVGFTFP